VEVIGMALLDLQGMEVAKGDRGGMVVISNLSILCDPDFRSTLTVFMCY